MQIALFGLGKMGSLIAEEASRHGDTIVSISTSSSRGSLSNAEVAIDFSLSHAVKNNVKECLDANVPLVIGTTGWEKDLPEIKTAIEQKNGAVLYCPNFSIGVTALLIALKQASRFLADSSFACGMFDLHHKDKLDSPSGTAKLLQKVIEENLKQPVPIASQRIGSYPGNHTVHFSSEEETLSFSHNALSRIGFAKGAIKATRWIVTRKGYFTLEDYVASY